MSERYLCSVGNDTKIVDLETNDIVQSFVSHLNLTNSVSWNLTDSYLVTCGVADCMKLHSNMFDNPISKSVGHELTHNNAVFANKSSNLFASCGNDQITMLWDANTLLPLQAFRNLPSRPYSMAFSEDDGLLCVGCEAGHKGDGIAIYDLRKIANSSAMTSIKMSNNEGAYKIKFSPFDKNILACCCTSGSINLNDVETKTTIHKYENSSEFPAIDLEFSQINNLLMVGSQSDGTLSFYDNKRNAVVNKVETGEEITCICLKRDGTTLLYGTKKGKFNVLDLRKTQSVLNTTRVHMTAVKCMKLQRSLNYNSFLSTNDTKTKAHGDSEAKSNMVSTDSLSSQNNKRKSFSIKNAFTNNSLKRTNTKGAKSKDSEINQHNSKNRNEHTSKDEYLEHSKDRLTNDLNVHDPTMKDGCSVENHSASSENIRWGLASGKKAANSDFKTEDDKDFEDRNSELKAQENIKAMDDDKSSDYLELYFLNTGKPSDKKEKGFKFEPQNRDVPISKEGPTFDDHSINDLKFTLKNVIYDSISNFRDDIRSDFNQLYLEIAKQFHTNRYEMKKVCDLDAKLKELELENKRLHDRLGKLEKKH